MPTEILMPALSPTMEEGTLAKWLVQEGDAVSAGDLLAEIETDKATMEFEAVDEGTVGRILIPEGAEGVKVNSPIAVLLAEGESEADISSTAVAVETAPPESAAEAAPPAPASAAPELVASAPPAVPAASSEGNRVFASPLARRIAADRGIDLSQVKGSGPKGRIVKADVESAQALPAVPSAAPVPDTPGAEAIKAVFEDREFEEVSLDGMRKIIAARLGEAKQTIPHFYLRRDIKLDDLLMFRSQANKQLEARGVKLSVNDFIIKACALALQTVPEANAVWAGDRIIKLKPSDVAVAVAVEGGLFTPVLRDAHLKSLSTLSTEMKELAALARDRRLAPHQYQGGSFAISNLGMFGIKNFDAVINPPHGSILAVGAGEKMPVVNDDGELAVATVMSVTLSVDHRVIDGALGAEFLSAVKTNLENPIGMLA
ncbi:MAG: pyruvate dehydrogenase complex dihydrolipoamide acetyltransferase [Boseongicola sp. SB0675_bin_26]|nr:pyruvate dehydrogenase complex dihydrolipoamide acetyltransferase [Boseongicola sp. SB0675_bin_26]